MGVRTVLALLALGVLAGCGPSQTVTVGAPDDAPGVVKRDIDLAKNVSEKAHARSEVEEP